VGQATAEKGFVSKIGGSHREKPLFSHCAKSYGLRLSMASADSSARLRHPVLDLIGCADMTLDEVDP
jgi:hypothetical protein